MTSNLGSRQAGAGFGLRSEGKTDAAKLQYREALRLDPDMSDAKSRLSALDTDLE